MKTPRIVDAHMHLGCPWTLFTVGWEIGDVMKLMDQLGIDRAYSTHHYWLAGRVREAVASSIESYERSEGRIPFLGVYDPREEKQSLSAIDGCVGHESFIGIKIHPSFHGTPADDARYEPVWSYAEQHNLPILSHTWSDTYNPVQKLSLPRLFARHVENHPKVSFVIGHAGGPGTGQHQTVELVRQYPNVYLDMAGDVFSSDLVPRMVKAVGSERILFGTDQPWIDPRANLARMVISELSCQDKTLMLGRNALRVFEPHLLVEDN